MPNERIDPTDIAGVNEQTQAWARGGETIVPIEMDCIAIEEDAIPALVEIVQGYANGGRTMLVWNHTPILRAGEEVKPMIEAALSRVVPLSVRKLPDRPVGQYHPGREDAESLAEELEGYDVVVSVGAGSITDVAKYARTLAEEKTGQAIRFVCFPTAASVTAFTSAIAVLMLDGCKRNFMSQLPDAIACDLQTIADAPPAMTRAGFADVLARSVAYGDWYLASELGMDDRFSLVPHQLLAPAETAMIAEAARIEEGNLEAVRALTEALLLAGMCMSVINHTAPISGWEHGISHYLDMTAERDGRDMALHGAQVSVGTLISARAYERAWNELDWGRVLSDREDRSEQRRTIEQVFAGCDATGAMMAELYREFDLKLDRWQASREKRRRFLDRVKAGDLDESLQRLVRPRAHIEQALVAAGAPRTFSDLDEPVSDETGLLAVLYGHLVRSRFTLGDLLGRAGWLDERTARLLIEAG
jgi:glycerol-1-phosphate dehydrogenase [NAD(P)+]